MKHKLIVLLTIFAVILGFLINHFYIPPVDISKNSAFSSQDLKSAYDYLDQFPADEKIYIFPSKERAYEIIGSFAEIRNYLSEYQNQSPIEYDFHQVLNFSQMLIIADKAFFDADPSVRKKMLTEVSYPFDFTSTLTDMKFDENACYAKTIQDRGVWTLSGYVAIGPHLGAAEQATNCVLAALDYVNGFPVRGGHFDLNALPSPSVRKPIMYFMQQCALEGRTTAQVNMIERSRGQVTALPSLQCVKEKLSTYSTNKK